MDKYEVLIFILMYSIFIAVTTACFGGANDVYTWERLPGVDSEPFGLLNWLKIFGLFTFNIPDIPVVARLLFMSPVMIMLAYFIYLNIPKNPLFYSPEP